jgi:hypothetical protein
MNDQPGVLIDHKQVVILVDDGQINRFRLEGFFGLRLESRDYDPVALTQSIPGRPGFPIDENLVALDFLLELTARHAGQLRGQPSVEALARGIGVDTEI